MKRRLGQSKDSELGTVSALVDADDDDRADNDPNSPTIDTPSPRRHGNPPLGEILVEQGTISSDDLARALAEQGGQGKLLGEVLIDLGLLNERQLLEVLSEQLHMPIVDLRMRFNLERAEYTPLTVIIVLSVQSAVGRRDFGVVVDGVSDVIDVAVGDVKPAPDLGAQVSTEFISGLAAVSGRMLMLLDIDQLIGGDVTGVAPMPAAANG